MKETEKNRDRGERGGEREREILLMKTEGVESRGKNVLSFSEGRNRT